MFAVTFAILELTRCVSMGPEGCVVLVGNGMLDVQHFESITKSTTQPRTKDSRPARGDSENLDMTAIFKESKTHI